MKQQPGTIVQSWTPTPEAYADLIVGLVSKMEKDPNWEPMLSKLYACANRLFITGGKQVPLLSGSPLTFTAPRHASKPARE